MIRTGAFPVSHGDGLDAPMTAVVKIEPYDGEERSWATVNSSARAGFIVLSSTLQPLHINPEAVELLSLLNRKDTLFSHEACDWGQLPEVLRQLGSEMVDFLKMRIDAADCRPIDLKRLAGDLLRPVRLRGVGIPDHRGIAQARIIITIEEVVPYRRSLP